MARRHFRGGRKRKRDPRFGISDDAFWRWWHRVGKKANGYRDLVTRKEADRVYSEWVTLGKPRVK